MKKLLEELNDIEIDLSEYEIKELSELEKIRMYRKVKESMNCNKGKKKLTKSVAAFAIGVLTPVLATGVYAGVKLVSNSIESMSEYEEGKLSNYKDIIGREVTKNGYTVQLNEIMFDSDSLLVNSTIKKEKGNLSEDFKDVMDYQVYINAEKISNVVGTEHEEISNDTEIQLSKFFYKEGRNLTGEADVKIVYTLSKEGDISELPTWEFEFKANLDKMKSEIKKAVIDKDIEFDGKKIASLKDVIVSPSTTVVNGSLINGSDYDVYLNIEDNLGNKLREDVNVIENNGGLVFKFYSPSNKIESLKITPIIKNIKTGEVIELRDGIIKVDL